MKNEKRRKGRNDFEEGKEREMILRIERAKRERMIEEEGEWDQRERMRGSVKEKGDEGDLGGGGVLWRRKRERDPRRKRERRGGSGRNQRVWV